MKISDLLDKINGIQNVLISLINEKDSKLYKSVIYYDKKTMETEIGDLNIVSYSYTLYHDIPMIIIVYATGV